MRFEQVVLEDADGLYARQHERWRVSHGNVLVYAKNASIAFTTPAKPMARVTVAMVTTGGVHLATQPPYDMTSRTGDISIRLIPGDAQPSELLFTHDHYDHGGADQDPNCMFPLEHLRTLAAERRIGAVARTHVGASGWIPSPAAFLEQAVPQIVRRLAADLVDVVLLTGG
jgi:D-proline reductase (dithiol) PrdB